MPLTIGPQGTYRTLDEAITKAPPGATVLLEPGRHAGARTTRRTPLTLVARHLPVVWNSQTKEVEETDPSQWSIITPSSAAGVRSEVPQGGGFWHPETRGTTHTGTVWKFVSGSPVPKPEQVVYSTAGLDSPQHPTRLAHWAKHSTYTPTVDAWADKLYGPSDWTGAYHYGFWSDNISPSSLYVRLPGDADPNGYGWTISADTAGSGGHGLTLDGASTGLDGCRVVGVVFRNCRNALRVNGVVRNLEVRNCLFEDGKTGVYFVSTIPSESPLLEDNLFRHTALSSDRPEDDPAVIPWRFVKQAFGTTVGKASESYGVYATLPPVAATIRRNTFQGCFDGIAWDGARTPDSPAGSEWDVYENTFRFLCDDPLDLDNLTVNVRIWGNRIDRCFTALSVVDAVGGPVYFVQNAVSEVGMYHMRKDGQGRKSPGGDGYVFKIQGDAFPAGCPPLGAFLVGNDVYSTYYDPAFPADGIHGAGLSNGSKAGFEQRFWLRGNRLRVSGYVWDARPSLSLCLDEDGNDLSTSGTASNLAGLRTELGIFPDLETTKLPKVGGKTYREYGKGLHSNVRGSRTAPFTEPLPPAAFAREGP